MESEGQRNWSERKESEKKSYFLVRVCLKGFSFYKVVRKYSKLLNLPLAKISSCGREWKILYNKGSYKIGSYFHNKTKFSYVFSKKIKFLSKLYWVVQESQNSDTFYYFHAKQTRRKF